MAGANLYYGRADPRAVIELVRSPRVDVLSLQELTPDAVAALDGAGLAALLPHRVFQPDDRAAGTGVASRYPLRSRPSDPGSYHLQPVVGVAVPRGRRDRADGGARRRAGRPGRTRRMARRARCDPRCGDRAHSAAVAEIVLPR